MSKICHLDFVICHSEIMSQDKMDKIVSLCKRRGFIFPSSEIYGGIGGVYDLGPLGVELKNNVKRIWWRDLVWSRDDVVGLDAAILMNPKVWQASGHIQSFTDPLVECRNCHKRFRADHLVEKYETDEVGVFSPKDLEQMEKVIKNMNCPECGQKKLTPPRQFNLMFKTYVGPVENDTSAAYLRPETAQGIFVNFKNVLSTMRKKIPFGIAQIGKSFRNEITPGNFVFRTREFEQMEIEWFCPSKAADKWFNYWKDDRMKWYLNLGIKEENLRFRKHEKKELAHYAKEAVDIEYKFPFGWSELEGIANRQDYDLKQHQKFSTQDLTYFDEETKEKYLPYVIEPSGGVDRALLAFLVDAYHEETVKGEKRVVLKFHKDLSPIKVSVLPLVRNKKELVKVAHAVYELVKQGFVSMYDELGSIGRRYRRQDEIGIPYAVTIDFETLKDKAVTVRDRDTMKQERVKIKDLIKTLKEKLEA